ncbi:MAG: zinc ABC transporter substrate-binding protein [Kiloniellaceae bacterium]
MRPICFLGAALLLCLGGVAPAAAQGIAVVTSIKPVHSLAAAVMQGAGSPQLIVRGATSPHSFGLRPSDAAALEQARLVIWVGEGLETSLGPALAALAKDATVIALSEVAGLNRLAYRPDAGQHGGHDAGQDGGQDEDHGGIDMHLWLDPVNVKVMAAAIADALIAADPQNRGIYTANARTMGYRIDRLIEEIAHDLAPVKDRPFIVFHDAFQYFDARFGLNNVGSVTVDPERQPGAARIRQIRAKVIELGAACVFAEPQFEPRLIEVIIEGSAARVGTLDPLGADLADGPELYFELMRANAAALKACLAPPG